MKVRILLTGGTGLLGAELHNPPYDQIAKLCGATGFCASTPETLAESLRSAIGSAAPAVIHAQVDPDGLSTLRKDLFATEPKSS